jgi:peptidoglycan/xylan/chitin deacetylase (PgdA/CDA1 family)
VTVRRPGPDHGLYSHAPRPSRPAWQWPGNTRIALCVFVYLECFEIDAPPGAHRDPRFHGTVGDLYPNSRAHTLFEYGNRIGIFRVLQALDRHGLVPTVAANANACERYPFLVNELQRRGAEFAGHGLSATSMITSRMTADEERALITRSIETVARAVGERPRGWVSQDYGESTMTSAYLAEAGITWIADWGNDDQPYWMRTTPPLVSIPNQADWDDVQLAWHRQISLADYRHTVCEAFDVLYEDAAASAVFFGLHVHPWFIGWPHRIGYLEAALSKIMEKPSVWRTTAGQAADYFRSLSSP